MDWQTPYTLPCGLELRNRLVFAPISTMTSTPIGKLSEEEIAFYERRAGQAGLLILGSASISPVGKAYAHNVSLSHDAVIPNLRKHNRKIQAQGAKSIVQLYHGGAASAYVPGHKKVFSVSDPTYHVMSDSEIQQVLLEFGRALQRAIRAGFNGVEFHGGNPFLIQQFLSPLTNRRHDFWGGDEERRFRFLEALIQMALAVRQAATSEPFVIGVRLAIAEKEAGGLRWHDTICLVKRLELLGIDYVHFNQENMLREPLLKEVATRLCVIGNGGIRTCEELEQALELTPLVSVARQLILEPDFPGEHKGNLLSVPEGLRKSIEASRDWYYYSG